MRFYEENIFKYFVKKQFKCKFWVSLLLNFESIMGQFWVTLGSNLSQLRSLLSPFLVSLVLIF
jgi:hypothetical protein